MIQRDLSFYYPDCNKEVCLVIASESLQCITQLIASYYSVSLIVSDDVEPDTCVSVVASMREEFASHFAGIKPLAADFKLFTAPFDFPVDDDPAPLQMELVELQCNDELKAKFYNSSPLSFFCDIALPSRNVPTFIAHVQRVVAMFHCLAAPTLANSSSPK